AISIRANRRSRAGRADSLGLGLGAVSLRDSSAPHAHGISSACERPGGAAASARRGRSGPGAVVGVPVRHLRAERTRGSRRTKFTDQLNTERTEDTEAFEWCRPDGPAAHRADHSNAQYARLLPRIPCGLCGLCVENP